MMIFIMLITMNDENLTLNIHRFFRKNNTQRKRSLQYNFDRQKFTSITPIDSDTSSDGYRKGMNLQIFINSKIATSVSPNTENKESIFTG